MDQAQGVLAGFKNVEFISDLDKSYFHGVMVREVRLEGFRRHWQEGNWEKAGVDDSLRVFL